MIPPKECKVIHTIGEIQSKGVRLCTPKSKIFCKENENGLCTGPQGPDKSKSGPPVKRVACTRPIRA